MAANWYPNQVPGANDTAVIPLAATNGAALDMTATVQNLVLVGGNLGTTGYSYDTLTVNGQINWTNGILGCATTNNGVLTLAGTNARGLPTDAISLQQWHDQFGQRQFVDQLLRLQQRFFF